MGRIRTIKPEFPQSQSMGRVSREARLLFVLLWTLADDSGRTRAASRMLASLLYPYDDDAPRLISGWLEELATVNAIVLYTVDGDDYLEVRNWLKHQKIDKPSKSKFPPFDESSRALANPREQSTTDQGPRTKDQGPLNTARVPLADRPADSAARSKPVDRPSDVPEQVWADWCAHRRKKRATVSATVIDGMRSEAAAAGVGLAEAMSLSVTNGWQGFRADWLKTKLAARIPSATSTVTSGKRIYTEHPAAMPTPYETPMARCDCGLCVKRRGTDLAARMRRENDGAIPKEPGGSIVDPGANGARAS